MNVEGIQSNIVHIREIISKYNPDIICLQEHWLFHFEENKISEIHPAYHFSIKCIDENNPIAPKQRPRGYGGICILWKKELQVTVLPDGSIRTQAIQVGSSTILMNTYMPCRGKYSNEEFKDEIDQLNEICSKYKHDNTIIIAGDMNVDIYKQDETRAKYFQAFMNNNNAKEVKTIKEPTYIHYDGVSNTKIDYILVAPKSAETTNESSYFILPDSSTNTSPHQALLLNIPYLQLRKTKRKKKKRKKFLKWKKADIDLYQETLNDYLNDVEDIYSVDAAIELLTKAIQAATEIAVPTTTIKENHKPPPWNDTIKSLTEESKKANFEWKQADCPGPESELYTRRKKINRELRKQQRIQNAIIREKKQEEIMQANLKDKQLFYKLVRKQRKTPHTETTELEANGSIYKDEDILDGWTDHFASLATPSQDPHFNEEYNEQVKEELEVISQLCKKIHTQNTEITSMEIKEALAELKNNKAEDETHLVSEHLKLGGDGLEDFLKKIINKIIQNKEIPNALKSGILHPIHKKGKAILNAGNYRGITIIKIIAKVLDIIIARHQAEAIPNTCNLQFSFTKDKSPSHATLLLNEAISEARDNDMPLYMITMDIQKAFDIVPHHHLLRKLYQEGLTGSWWELKKSSYTDMTGKVIWRNEIGKSFPIDQGTRQGGNASTQDFKTEIKPVTTKLIDADEGLHIGNNYVGVITCADDVILLANTEEALQFQLMLVNDILNKERMKIHPQKSSISIMGLTDSEMEYLKEVKPWRINGTPLNIKNGFTHLGIQYEFTTKHGTENTTIEDRLEKGRNTTYSLMGAGLHGVNGINPITSHHMYKIYVQPRVMYSLEMLHVTKTNIDKLEGAFRKFAKHIQSLPMTAANSSVYILLGCLPVQATLEQQQMTVIPSLLKNPIMLNLIIRQIATKTNDSNSWVIATQQLLRKYELPPLIDIIESDIKKEKWKTAVKKAVATYWKTQIENESKSKSTLKYLNTIFKVNKPHLVWQSTTTDCRDVKRAIVKAKLMTGTYTLQYNRAIFNQTCDTTCPLCNDGEEDVKHFIMQCNYLHNTREPYLKEIYNTILCDYPEEKFDDESLTHLILDPTHPCISDTISLDAEKLNSLEKITRLLCFSLHRERAMKIGYRC